MDQESFRKYIEIANGHESIVYILQELAYKKVAVQITKSKEVIHEYTVFIDDAGKISDVKPGNLEPEIIIQMEEEHLLDMIANKDAIKASPGLAVGYFNKVKMPLSLKMKIMGIAMNSGLI